MPPPHVGHEEGGEEVEQRLLLLVHGNNAGPEDFIAAEGHCRRIASGRSKLRLTVVRAASNARDTHGGIGLLGRRLADELADALRPLCAVVGGAARGGGVKQGCSELVYRKRDGTSVELRAPATPISFDVMGHSLGGLVTRWCIGHLHACGVFEAGILRPRRYISLCSPHVGVRAPGWHIGRSLINLAGVLGQTEQELVLNDSGGVPMLAELADPSGDAMSGLRLFAVRTCVAMADYDTLVPAPTAAICAGVTPGDWVDGGATRGARTVAEPEPEPEPKPTAGAADPWKSAKAAPMNCCGGHGGDFGADTPVATAAWRWTVAPAAFALLPDGALPVGPQGWGWPRDREHGWVSTSPGMMQALNMPSQVLAGLQTVEWERVLLSAPGTALVRKTAHDFPVGKKQPASAQAASSECCALLCEWVMADVRKPM